MTPIKVQIPSRLIKALKRQAREAYPQETCAFLLGIADGAGTVEVREVFTPSGSVGDETQVNASDYTKALRKAQKRAQEADLVLVGDYHTHTSDSCLPWKWHHQSETDITQQAIYRFAVYAIGTVCQYKSGRRVASIKFWGPTVPVQVEEL